MRVCLFLDEEQSQVEFLGGVPDYAGLVQGVDGGVVVWGGGVGVGQVHGCGGEGKQRKCRGEQGG